MSFRSLLFFGTLSAIAAATPLVAQDVPPPTFPFSLRAPENAAWSVSILRKDQEGNKSSTTGNEESTASTRKATPSLQKLEVKKTAPIYYESGSVRDGKNWERWIILAEGNIFQITKNAGDAGWSRLQSDSFGGDVSNYAAADFEEFKWIDKSNYKGVDMMEGERPAYLFELTTEAPISRSEELNFDHGAAQMAKEAGLAYNRRTIRAWIDPKTQLPIKLDKGTEVKDYTFGPAPAARLMPPPGVIAVLQSWLADLKKTRR